MIRLAFAFIALVSSAVFAADILTPAAPATPRINGPTIYGERPGRPFLYHIPATGERPMTFVVDGLPNGLKLNEKPGDTPGRVDHPGKSQAPLRPPNSAGTIEKKLKIVSGKKTPPPPPMGWNSWNCWAGAVDQ